MTDRLWTHKEFQAIRYAGGTLNDFLAKQTRQQDNNMDFNKKSLRSGEKT